LTKIVRDLTPIHLRCKPVGPSCPAVHELANGRLVVVGSIADVETLAELEGNIAPHEEAVIVPRDLLTGICADGALKDAVARLESAAEALKLEMRLYAISASMGETNDINTARIFLGENPALEAATTPRQFSRGLHELSTSGLQLPNAALPLSADRYAAWSGAPDGPNGASFVDEAGRQQKYVAITSHGIVTDDIGPSDKRVFLAEHEAVNSWHNYMNRYIDGKRGTMYWGWRPLVIGSSEGFFTVYSQLVISELPPLSEVEDAQHQ
jgi:hypothetical protein